MKSELGKASGVAAVASFASVTLSPGSTGVLLGVGFAGLTVYDYFAGGASDERLFGPPLQRLVGVLGALRSSSGEYGGDQADPVQEADPDASTDSAGSQDGDTEESGEWEQDETEEEFDQDETEEEWKWEQDGTEEELDQDETEEEWKWEQDETEEE